MEIVEVGPRDGLQNEKRVLPTGTKVEYVRRAIAAGLRRIEVAAFARPDRVPQMADAEDVLRAVPRPDGVRYAALVLNGRGLDRILALDPVHRPHEINYVVVATDEFSRRNQGMTTMASLGAFHALAGRARTEGLAVTLTIAAAFGCPFTGEVGADTVREIAAQAGDIDELCLADTIGVGVPAQVIELAAAVRDVAPLRAHFHNTRNTGYANAITAVAQGFVALDASLGGIGGCPFAPAATGNIGTEDLAYLLNRSGVACGVAVTEAAGTGAWIGAELGLAQSPAQLGRAGDFPGDLAR